MASQVSRRPAAIELEDAGRFRVLNLLDEPLLTTQCGPSRMDTVNRPSP